MTSAEPTRLLIVDDDQTIRRSAESLLTRPGYEVVLAADGVEGLTKLQEWEPAVMHV